MHLRARVDAPLAHFIARLEDVHPDGRVSLVAAALLNGAQRGDPLRPEPLVPGRILENERLVRERQWAEDIPRELQ